MGTYKSISRDWQEKKKGILQQQTLFLKHKKQKFFEIFHEISKTCNSHSRYKKSILSLSLSLSLCIIIAREDEERVLQHRFLMTTSGGSRVIARGRL